MNDDVDSGDVTPMPKADDRANARRHERKGFSPSTSVPASSICGEESRLAMALLQRNPFT
jgi:hypothetical protein